MQHEHHGCPAHPSLIWCRVHICILAPGDLKIEAFSMLLLGLTVPETAAELIKQVISTGPKKSPVDTSTLNTHEHSLMYIWKALYSNVQLMFSKSANVVHTHEAV